MIDMYQCIMRAYFLGVTYHALPEFSLSHHIATSNSWLDYTVYSLLTFLNEYTTC